jgi:hypothetical protein
MDHLGHPPSRWYDPPRERERPDCENPECEAGLIPAGIDEVGEPIFTACPYWVHLTDAEIDDRIACARAEMAKED